MKGLKQRGSPWIYRVGLRQKGGGRQEVIWVYLKPITTSQFHVRGESLIRGFSAHDAEELYTSDVIRELAKNSGCYDEFLVDGSQDLPQLIANLQFGESSYEVAAWLVNVVHKLPPTWAHELRSFMLTTPQREDKRLATGEEMWEKMQRQDAKTSAALEQKRLQEATRLVNALTKVGEIRGRQTEMERAASMYSNVSLADMAAKLDKGLG